LFNKEQNVEVSDTTAAAQGTAARQQKNFKIDKVLIKKKQVIMSYKPTSTTLHPM